MMSRREFWLIVMIAAVAVPLLLGLAPSLPIPSSVLEIAADSFTVEAEGLLNVGERGPGTMARWYGVAMTTGSSVANVNNWPDRIRAVKPEAVNAVAKAYLDKRRSVTGYLIKDTRPEEKRS